MAFLFEKCLSFLNRTHVGIATLLQRFLLVACFFSLTTESENPRQEHCLDLAVRAEFAYPVFDARLSGLNT